MSNEHFVAGASEHADPMDELMTMSLLGHVAPTTVRRQLEDKQAARMYVAENWWIDPSHSASIGSRSTSANNAKDLLHEAIFHPHMDEIPGIEHVRNNLLNNPNSVQISGRKINKDDSVSGRVYLDGSVKLRTSRGPKDTLKIYKGWVNPITKRIEESADNPRTMVDQGDEDSNAFTQQMRDETGALFRGFKETPIKGHVRLGVVTHEAAHSALSYMTLNHPQFGDVGQGMIGHSWPMARTHIHAVRALFGDKHAKVLKDHYERLGVDFGR